MRCLALALSLLASACMTGPASALPIEGTWGAPQATLELTAESGRLEEGCGEIVMDPLQPDAQGRFAANGRQTSWRGGPQRADEPEPSDPVRISGRVAGDVLTLAIAAKDEPVRELEFRRGMRAKIVRCY